jgi:hypothetical protein
LAFAKFQKKIANTANHGIVDDRIFLLIVDLANTTNHRLRVAARMTGSRPSRGHRRKDFDGKSFPFCRKGKTCTAAASRNT